jgi:hypothetical protein
MAFDRSDFEQLSRKERGEQALAKLPSLALLNQAEISAKVLTNDPNWDLFLRILQGSIDTTVAQADALLRALADPLLTDDAEIRRVRLQMLLCNERIAAWTAAIGLPKELANEAVNVKEYIEKLTRDMDDGERDTA